MRLEPGEHVDRYVILYELGRGGNATVYSARHRVLGTLHAIKVLRDPTPELRERLIREGQVQARLDPQYVLPVTDVFDIRSGLALLMPLVQGASLDRLLLKCRLSPPEVLQILQPVTLALRGAHAHGIVHRDLKPANILLDQAPHGVRVRVADFGIARTSPESDVTAPHRILGSPAYASPEQLRDAAAVDTRSDLWSLGVLLYELCTGERPFAGDTLLAILNAVTNAEYSIEDVPEIWRPMVAALLKRDREERSQSIDEVTTFLNAIEVPDTPSDLASRLASVRTVARSPLGIPDEATNATWPPLTSMPSVRADIPRSYDSFVGRTKELDTLGEWLAAGARVITIHGPGGVGKTRFAAEAAAACVRNGYETIFCEFTEAATAEEGAAALARALGCPLGDEPIQAVAHLLASRAPCIYVLDNVEQLRPVVAALLLPWLHATPGAQFVLTSREVLGLRAERVLPLKPLDREPAIKLLKQRVAAVRPDLGSDFPAIAAQIVELLDGLPLAIELAATRASVLSPQQILQRLSQRFRLLVDPRRDPRQVTLEHCIGWSWDLFDERDAATLEQLSVFDGSFTIEDAEAIVVLAEETWLLDVLQSLASKSMLQVRSDDRYHLLVSIREYAARRLQSRGGFEAARQRHAAWFARLGATSEVHKMVRTGNSLAVGPQVDGRGEIVAAFRALPHNDEHAFAAALARATWLDARLLGPYPPAMAMLQAALERPLDELDRLTVGLCLLEADNLCGGGSGAGLALAPELFRLASSIGNLLVTAVLHDQWGRALMTRGDTTGARIHLEKALASHEHLGEPVGVGTIQCQLCTLELYCGDDKAAARALDRAEATCSGDAGQVDLMIHRFRGHLARLDGDLDSAEKRFLHGLASARRKGNASAELLLLWEMGRLKIDQVQRHSLPAREAVVWLEDALHLSRQLGSTALKRIQISLGAALALAGDVVAAEGHLREAAHGSGDANRRVPAFSNLSTLLLNLDRPEEALTAARQAVELGSNGPSFAGDQGLLAYVEALYACGHLEQALEVLDAVKQGPSTGFFSASMDLCRASILADQGHPTRARLILDSLVLPAVAMKASHRLTIAMIECTEGNGERALEALEPMTELASPRELYPAVWRQHQELEARARSLLESPVDKGKA